MQRRMLSDQERQQVLFDWNQTAADYRNEQCLHHLVESQVALRPDAVAVVCGDDQLGYRELDRRANQLARCLRGRGVGPGVLIALCLPRSLDMVVTILGVLKAGAAYVPVSPKYPRERIALMIADAGAALLVTQRELSARLAPGGADAGGSELRCQALILEDLAAELAALPGDAPESPVTPADVAYVIYTSGSTGTPKGVVIEHRGICNSVLAHIASCGLGPSDRVLQFAAYTFDGSVLEIMMTLAAGATLVLLPDGELVVGEPLARLLEDRGITFCFLPPSVLTTLPARPLPALRTLISAGDVLPAALAQRFAQGRRLGNEYGPTEASVCVTLGWYSATDAVPSIGRPLPNTRVYILDDEQQPVGIGETGELYLGGVGVARGYLNRPELTAARFLPDPFSPHAGARMYRSGDLARLLPDGRIEYVGRADQQVKIRGFRIELGEVEAALLRHPGVAQCAVVARAEQTPDASEPGSKRLVAYLVARPGTELPVGALREFLSTSLPEFMLPSAFVTLPQLPLTAHGKIDLAALPAPGRARPQLASALVAPRTAAERAIVEIYAAVLRIDEVGVQDDFFELGGDSLLAAQVGARVRTALDVELPLRALFEHSTAEALARHVEGLSPARQDGIPRVRRDGPLPLSSSQQQVWLTSQIEAQSPLYNEPYALTIVGPLDVEQLTRALQALLDRHACLRSAIEIDAGRPVQRIPAAVPLPLERLDLSALDAAARQKAVRQLHDAQAQKPFDLRTPPLLRVLLVRLNDDEHQLLLTLHHAIFDGVSFSNVFLPELVQLYRAGVAGQPAALPTSEIEYADFAAWERVTRTPEVLAESLDYWRRQLAGLPVLQLPTDRPRPAVGSFSGARHSLHLPAALVTQLTALAQREGATLYMALLAAFAALLHRYTGQADFPIASVVSTQDRPQLQGLIGPFVNTVVLRADLASEPSFRALLRRVRETTLAAVGHRELPFEKLVEALRPERRLGQHPLFQVLFLLDPPSPVLPSGWSVSRFEAHNGTAMCDLSLQLDRRPEGLLGFIEYSTDLFEPATIARWARHLEVLLAGAVAEPDRPVFALPLLPPEERAQIDAWSGGTAEVAVDACLHTLFSAQARRSPDAVAVVCDQTRLTYAQLDAQSDRLARRLRALGVGPDALVALCTERAAELVVGILGILKAGGAYVPLDPVYPRERLSFLLEDTAAPVLVTQSKLRPSLPPYAGQIVCVDELDDDAAPEKGPPTPVGLDHLAYVIYTSGSTGKPKGVKVTHRNVVRLFRATDAWFGFSA